MCRIRIIISRLQVLIIPVAGIQAQNIRVERIGTKHIRIRNKILVRSNGCRIIEFRRILRICIQLKFRIRFSASGVILDLRTVLAPERCAV